MDPDGEAIFLAAIAVVGVALTAYDTYQAYQRGGVGAAAEQLAYDAALSIVGGGVLKVGAKVGKVALRVGKRVIQNRRTVQRTVRAGGIGCFVAGTAVLSASGVVGIEALAAGQRVASAYEDQDTEVTEDWQQVRVVIGEEGTADHAVVEMLRPPDWLEQHEGVVGAQLFIDSEELNIAAWGVIDRVVSAPKPAPGSGRLVLATSERWSRDVYELELEGGMAPVQVTGEHPIYFLDADGWVKVRDLQVGERLQTEKGALAVASLERERGLQRVYNIEVEGEHEYLIGDAGLRVHNAYKKACPPRRKKSHGNDKRSTRAQHGYEITDTKTGEVVKTGVSGVKLKPGNQSVRANAQARRWSRDAGEPGRYKARVVKKIPAGKGARARILAWEIQNARRLIRKGHLTDLDKHGRNGEGDAMHTCIQRMCGGTRVA